MSAHNPHGSHGKPLHYLTAHRRRATEYEYRTVTVPPALSKNAARAMLTAEAEVGKWELARTVIYVGGTTKYWLRRKIITVVG